MVLGLKKLHRSTSPDSSTFHDADNGCTEHTQHAPGECIHNNAWAGAPGFTNGNGHAGTDSPKSPDSPAAPKRNSIHDNVVGRFTRQDSNADHSATNGVNNRAPFNDDPGYTGVANDPFYSVKAPAPLTTNTYTNTNNNNTSAPPSFRQGTSPSPSPTSPHAKSLASGGTAVRNIGAGAGAGAGASVKRSGTVGGTFANGPGTSGPNATPDLGADFTQKRASAEGALDEKTRKSLIKQEAKEAKSLAKVIKSEGVVEQKNLESAIKELSKLQKVQKEAASEESKALSAHNSAIATEHKSNTRFVAAKTAHERDVAEVRGSLEALEMSRDHAMHQTELLQEKSKEVEMLRKNKEVDDRVREGRLRELKEVGKGRV